MEHREQIMVHEGMNQANLLAITDCLSCLLVMPMSEINLNSFVKEVRLSISLFTDRPTELGSIMIITQKILYRQKARFLQS